jgi:hypothetical protein
MLAIVTFFNVHAALICMLFEGGRMQKSGDFTPSLMMSVNVNGG